MNGNNAFEFHTTNENLNILGTILCASCRKHKCSHFDYYFQGYNNDGVITM